MADANKAQESTAEDADQKQPSPQIDENKARQYLEKLRMEQNLPVGAIAGSIAALAGAAVWALFTALTNYQIGLMAIGVGFLVGYAVRTFGKGIETIFGIMGAALSLLGCILGNFGSVLIALSMDQSIPFDMLLKSLTFDTFFDVMAQTFHPMDLLFYGFSVYEGYRFSFRKIKEKDYLEATAV